MLRVQCARRYTVYLTSIVFLGYMYIRVYLCIKVWWVFFNFFLLEALPELQHLGLLLSGF